MHTDSAQHTATRPFHSPHHSLGSPHIGTFAPVAVNGNCGTVVDTRALVSSAAVAVAILERRAKVEGSAVVAGAQACFEHTSSAQHAISILKMPHHAPTAAQEVVPVDGAAVLSMVEAGRDAVVGPAGPAGPEASTRLPQCVKPSSATHTLPASASAPNSLKSASVASSHSATTLPPCTCTQATLTPFAAPYSIRRVRIAAGPTTARSKSNTSVTKRVLVGVG